MPFFISISAVDNSIIKAGYADNDLSFIGSDIYVSQYYDQFSAKMYCAGLTQFLNINNLIIQPQIVKKNGDDIFFAQNLSDQALFYGVYVQVQNAVLAGKYILARALISAVPDINLSIAQQTIKKNILNSIPNQDYIK